MTSNKYLKAVNVETSPLQIKIKYPVIIIYNKIHVKCYYRILKHYIIFGESELNIDTDIKVPVNCDNYDPVRSNLHYYTTRKLCRYKQMLFVVPAS